MSSSLSFALFLALTVGQMPTDPPYPRFKGLSFEPSAVAFHEEDDRYVLYVLNDKDPLIHRFVLAPDDKKQQVTGIANKSDDPIGVIAVAGANGHGTFLPKKFEALAPLTGGGFIAATAFDRPELEYNQIVIFNVKPRKDGLPPLVEGVQALENKAVRENLQGLPPASDCGLRRTSFKIEGISPCSNGTKLLIGVRRYYNFAEGERDIKEVVLIARFRLDEKQGLVYEGAINLSMTEGGPSLPMGLSDLQRDRDGSYLIVTTREDPKPPRIEGHAGALYRVPSDVLEGDMGETKYVRSSLGKPLRTFIAKSEGIAILPGKGRYLVVFDDDDGWKELFQNYAGHEALYEMITLPDGPGNVPSK